MIDASHIVTLIEGRPIVRNVTIHAGHGEFIGLIGPNGSGKSTLLRTLAGFSPHASGELLITGKPIRSFTSKQLARVIGYVPQDTTVDFDFSARDIVLMGRHPYLSRFGSESMQDREIAQRAMQQTATLHLANRAVTRLSGGQRQMIFIAKALAQEPQLLLLDEPISALDIRYQLHVLELMQQWAKKGHTVIAALHDLNLAARFCHRIALLSDGELIGVGTPEEVLNSKMIRRAYDVHAEVGIDPWINSPSITAISY